MEHCQRTNNRSLRRRRDVKQTGHHHRRTALLLCVGGLIVNLAQRLIVHYGLGHLFKLIFSLLCVGCLIIALAPRLIFQNGLSSQKLKATFQLPSQIVPRLRQALQSYCEFIRTAANQDKGLKFLQYTLWLASRAYEEDSESREGLCKLSWEISLARYATRLIAFPTAVEGVVNRSWASSSETYPETFKIIGDILAWSMLVYYPAEHIAYLHWKVPEWLANGRSGAFWCTWSCRGWGAYVLAEIIQNLLQWREVLQQQSKDKKDDNASAFVPNAETLAVLEKLKLQCIRNVLFLLPLTQYCLPNWDTDPWLPEDLVNFLFWLESVVCLYQAFVE
mmetsp:Transcript_4104/g.5388  ORF Transcript_4104/g.5388 Transcript_4104/m.5388 type:complete len:334 (-) Transcript_4104:72-1073(-)